MALTFRLFLCLGALGICLFSYIEKQNELTKLRIQIPLVSKEIRVIHEENTRLQYEIEQFESPEHLLELARQSEFSHLKQPLVKEILTVAEGSPVQTSHKPQEIAASVKQRPALGFGAKD